MKPASLVVLEQKLRVDDFEAEPAADVLVVLLDQRSQHDAFSDRKSVV